MKKENMEILRSIPLGGLEKIGMNITAFECNRQYYCCGLWTCVPRGRYVGIDLVIPDITYLKGQCIEKVKGFVITHGHEDHIGAFLI